MKRDPCIKVVHDKSRARILFRFDFNRDCGEPLQLKTNDKQRLTHHAGEVVLDRSVPPCKAKRQYLLTCKVNGYSLLVLDCSIRSCAAPFISYSTDFILFNSVIWGPVCVINRVIPWLHSQTVIQRSTSGSWSGWSPKFTGLFLGPETHAPHANPSVTLQVILRTDRQTHEQTRQKHNLF